MDKVAANIAARKAVEEVFGLAIDEAGVLLRKFDAATATRFWVQLRALVDETIPDAKPKPDKGTPKPMSDEESRRFGKTPMPWGMHEGQAVDEVPTWYLEKVTESDEFKNNVRRYLRSPRVAGEPD